MSEEDSVTISERTYNRTVEPVNKAGFSDGVTEGHASTFQSSFDEGYQLGLEFGLCIGYNNAMKRADNNTMDTTTLKDSAKINCQICLDKSLIEQNVKNIKQLQKESNDGHKGCIK